MLHTILINTLVTHSTAYNACPERKHLFSYGFAEYALITKYGTFSKDKSFELNKLYTFIIEGQKVWNSTEI
jgi:hypothetical protein